MASCINLLRVLNKLTKWKHSRIMVSEQLFIPLFWTSCMPAALTVFLIVKHEHMGYCMYVLILLHIR